MVWRENCPPHVFDFHLLPNTSSKFSSLCLIFENFQYLEYTPKNSTTYQLCDFGQTKIISLGFDLLIYKVEEIVPNSWSYWEYWMM